MSNYEQVPVHQAVPWGLVGNVLGIALCLIGIVVYIVLWIKAWWNKRPSYTPPSHAQHPQNQPFANYGPPQPQGAHAYGPPQQQGPYGPPGYGPPQEAYRRY